MAWAAAGVQVRNVLPTNDNFDIYYHEDKTNEDMDHGPMKEVWRLVRC